MAREVCTARKIEQEDFLFSRRDVRAFTGWGDTQVRVHLDRLVALEYVLMHRGDRGQSFVYELVYDGQGKDGGRFLPGLIDVEKLRREGNGGAQNGSAALPPTPTAANLAGVNGHVAGGSRGQNGVNAGGSRPPENAPFSSEKPAAAAKVPANAHLDGAALAVAS
jgi:hypothetical protein